MKISIILFFRFDSFKLKTSISSFTKIKFTLLFDRAHLINSSNICFNSTLLDFKKFLLAGILKNKFFTLIIVPDCISDFFSSKTFESFITISLPILHVFVLDLILNSATDDIEERASPLKPIVLIL